jgi:hypothetical protein
MSEVGVRLHLHAAGIVVISVRAIPDMAAFHLEVENFSQHHMTTGVSFLGELPMGYAEVPLSGSDDARGGRRANFMIVFASIL